MTRETAVNVEERRLEAREQAKATAAEIVAGLDQASLQELQEANDCLQKAADTINSDK